MEKQFGRFADIPARSKIALQTLTNMENKPYPLHPKNFRRPLHIERSSEKSRTVCL